MAREDKQNKKERFFDEDWKQDWKENWEKDWKWRRHERHQHGGNFVFGAVLIVAGGLFLLNALGIVSWDVWSHIWAFWPVILILLGAHLMLDREPALHSIMQVLTLVILIMIGLYAVRATNPKIHYNPSLDNFLNKLGQIDRMKGQNQIKAVQ